MVTWWPFDGADDFNGLAACWEARALTQGTSTVDALGKMAVEKMAADAAKPFQDAVDKHEDCKRINCPTIERYNWRAQATEATGGAQASQMPLYFFQEAGTVGECRQIYLQEGRQGSTEKSRKGAFGSSF